MNVLLITTDQHCFSAVGCNGNPVIRTPNIDRLAREGISFNRHTCSSPICTPARVSILNGRYARSHGAFMVGYDYDPQERTLPHWLSEAGCRCGIAGKAHFEAELNGNAARVPGGGPYYGFHEAYLTEDIQYGAYLDWVKANHPQWFEEVRLNTHEDDAKRWGVTDGRVNACYKSKLPDEVHPSRWIADRSMEFIARRAAAEEPFFLWTSFVDPHHPWNPIEPFASMYNPDDLPDPLLEAGAHGGPDGPYNSGADLDVRELKRVQALYYGMISHLDMHVGRILDSLATAGILDQTAVVFTSDHGDHDCQHRMIRKFGGLYDNILRVPMIVRAPCVAAPGTATSEPLPARRHRTDDSGHGWSAGPAFHPGRFTPAGAARQRSHRPAVFILRAGLDARHRGAAVEVRLVRPRQAIRADGPPGGSDGTCRPFGDPACREILTTSALSCAIGCCERPTGDRPRRWPTETGMPRFPLEGCQVASVRLVYERSMLWALRRPLRNFAPNPST